ncbi:MAG: serine/threonine protein kinase [bacterium]|nr:serine/threonine protein kinase [bacterium]
MIELKGQVGKYKIVKKLGSGGFGTVYLAEDTILKTYRALKIPHRLGPQGEKALQECILQTKLLDHPNIVKLLTVDIVNRDIIMVMEYIKGTDLEKLLDDKDKLPIPEALGYFKQLLSALSFAHSYKVIHRDIRPSNVLLNEKNAIKVTDFGTSTLLDQKQYATTKIGSPPYMAPEQFEGRAVLASDIYSAGCLFYEMVSGLPPVVLANPMEIYKKAKARNYLPLKKKVPELPDELDVIVARTLAPELEERYRDVEQVLEDLDGMGQNKKADNTNKIQEIQVRLDARHQRTDYICWNCRKAMPRKMKKCLYCGEEQ